MLKHAELTALAKKQDDVVSRQQLASLGLDRFVIRTQVRARRWRTIGPNVVAMTTGTASERQRRWIAVLHCGPRALLAGLSAATSYGLRGWPAAGVQVLVPHGVELAQLDGVHVHRTRQWRDRGGTPPRSLIADALVDAAVWAKHDVAAVGLLAAGVQQRLVTAEALREPASRAYGRRALLRATCADLASGAEALSEIRFGRIAARAGLPDPVRQAVRTDASGRRRYLDADFGAFAVEIDGMPHLDPVRHAADLQRQNDLVLAGSGYSGSRLSPSARTSQPSWPTSAWPHSAGPEPWTRIRDAYVPLLGPIWATVRRG